MLNSLNPSSKLCVVRPSGSIILPAGRLSYPTLFVAKAMPGEDKDKAVFSTAILLPKDVDLTPAVEVINAMIAPWGKLPPGKTVRKPFLKTAEKMQSTAALDVDEFPFMIRTKTNSKPPVVYASNVECNNPNEVYPGRWARLSVQPFTWDNVTGGKGVSFALNSVMLLDHDERIAGGRPKTEDDFEGMIVQDGNGPDFQKVMQSAFGSAPAAAVKPGMGIFD